VSGYSQT